ncbi:MAG: hypothetical protein PF693_12095 [Spirochaetia bacterium]|jgi:hypothetical protein|nr:hypothetical protein [Spirochaetia bacterium]
MIDNIWIGFLGFFCISIGYYGYFKSPNKIHKAKRNKSDSEKKKWILFSKAMGIFNIVIGSIILAVAIYFIITEL